jgi:hypothetical protein
MQRLPLAAAATQTALPAPAAPPTLAGTTCRFDTECAGGTARHTRHETGGAAGRAITWPGHCRED